MFRRVCCNLQVALVAEGGVGRTFNPVKVDRVHGDRQSLMT